MQKRFVFDDYVCHSGSNAIFGKQDSRCKIRTKVPEPNRVFRQLSISARAQTHKNWNVLVGLVKFGVTCRQAYAAEL